MPRVSVVIPLFNGEEYIKETLESVQRQTFEDFEVIVVDDGSTDRSREIVKSVSDARIRLVEQENFGRPAGPRNVALKQARGEYVAFLDADDLWETNKLDKQVEFLDQNGSCQMVGCRFRRIDHESKLLSDTVEPVSIFDPNPGRWFDFLVKGNCFANSGVMCRRAAILEVGGLNEAERLRGTEDFDLWLRIAKSGETGILDISLLRYRMHPAGISKNRSFMRRGIFSVIAGNLGEQQDVEVSKENRAVLLPRFLDWALNFLADEKADPSDIDSLRQWAGSLGSVQKLDHMIRLNRLTPKPLFRYLVLNRLNFMMRLFQA